MKYNLSQEQLDILQAQAQVRNYQYQVAATADPNIAHTLSNLASTYTGITPGVATSLARAGVGVGDLANATWQQEVAARVGKIPGTRSLNGGRRYSWSNNPEKYAKHLSGNEFAALPPQEQRDFKRALEKERGDGGGGLLGTIGDIVGKGFDLATTPVRYIADKSPIVQDVVKPVVREGMVGLQASGEALAGYSRTSWDYLLHGNPLINEVMGGDPNDPATNPVNIIKNVPPQTTLYQQVVGGKSVGEGFFPSYTSPAMRAQAEAARRYSPYLIGGHAWTPGRALADGIGLEPDDEAFNLISGFADGYVAWKMDPANFALQGLSAIRAGRSAVVADEAYNAIQAERIATAPTGAVRWFRKMTAPQRFSDWSESNGFHAVLHEVTKSHDARLIQTTLRGRNGYISAELADALSQTTTDAESLALIKKAVGTLDVTDALKWRAPKFFADPRGRNPKMLQDMPVNNIQFSDKADLSNIADEIDRVLVNGDVSQAERHDLINQLFVAARDPATMQDRQKAVMGLVFDALGRSAKAHGVSDDAYRAQLRARGLSADIIEEQVQARGFDTLIEEARAKTFKSWEKETKLQQDNMGDTIIDARHMSDGGDGVDIAHRADEMTLFDNNIVFPDAREMRRLVSPISQLAGHKLLYGTTDALDMMLQIWKPLILSKPSTAMRVVGEEQIRIAVTGYASLFNHPLTAIAYALGNPDNRWIERLASHESTKKAGEKLLDFELKHGYRPYKLGGLAADDDMFMQAMYRRFEALGRDTHGMKEQMSALSSVSRYSDLAPLAVAEELERFRSSKVAVSILENGPEATKDAMRTGKLRTVMHADSVDQEVDDIAEALNVATKNHPVLRQGILTGRINDYQITRLNGKISKAAQKQIRAILDSTDDLPDTFRINKWHTLDKGVKQRLKQGLDNSLDFLMDGVLTRPSNFFSRNVYLQQAYLDALEKAFPYMDGPSRVRLLKEFPDANIPKKTAERFQYMHRRLAGIEYENPKGVAFRTQAQYEAMRNPKFSGLKPVEDQIDYDAAVLFAKHRAVKQTKELLYDLSKRSQIMDLMRVIFPFGEAFKEVTSRWAKLTWQNPQVLRRLEQVVMGGRSAGSGQAMEPFTGVTAAPDQGFFYKDQYGQEVMGIPGGQLLTKATVGIPIPLKGSVQGLNLVGQGIPGTNPMLQVPMSYIIPDKPQWDWFKNMVMPMGTPKGEGALGKIFRSFEPSIVQKIHDAVFTGEQDRVYAGTVKDVAAYLLSTHKYDIQGPNAEDEINRLLSDAKSKAFLFSIVRGLSQQGLPTAPSPEWLAFDKKGHLTLLWGMKNWYQKRADKVGYEQAGTDFLNRFGLDNILLTQPKSKALIPAAPINVDGHAWARDHPDIVRDYPTAYGLFAPSQGEFDNDAYQAQFERGERIDITAKDMIHMANKRLASLLYNEKKVQMGSKITKVEENALRDLRQQYTIEFPGFGEDPIPFARREITINELTRAADDPRLKNTEAGKALNLYLNARDDALFMFPAGFGSRKAASARFSLMELGESLVDKYSSFQPMWDSVFKGEVNKVL